MYLVPLADAGATDYKMLAQVRRVSAWLLARGVRVSFRWIPSEWSTADDPSRLTENIASGTDVLEDVLPAQSQGPRASRTRPVDTPLVICSAPAVDAFQEGRDSFKVLIQDQKTIIQDQTKFYETETSILITMT